jgi:hypothetical protein
MMRWISITAIGSMPANGSSSRMKRGCVASAGDFHAAALAARQRQRRRLAQMLDAQLLQQAGQALLDLGLASGLALLVLLQLQHGAHVVFHAELAEDRGFLRQIGQAQARTLVDRHAATGWPSMKISPPSLRTRPTIM